MKFLFASILLACVVLAAGLVSCQTERRQQDPSYEDIDKWATALVDALLEHPTYQESLNDDSQQDNNGEDIDRWVEALVDALLEHPKYQESLNDDELVDEVVTAFADALLENSKYLEYLYDDEEWAAALVDAQMSHPKYLEYLYDDEPTREEECAAIILSATVMSEDYTPPSDSEVDRLCAWYIGQVE